MIKTQLTTPTLSTIQHTCMIEADEEFDGIPPTPKVVSQNSTAANSPEKSENSAHLNQNQNNSEQDGANPGLAILKENGDDIVKNDDMIPVTKKEAGNVEKPNTSTAGSTNVRVQTCLRQK